MKQKLFVRNKSIIKTFLTSKHCVRLKHKSVIHIKASSCEKVVDWLIGNNFFTGGSLNMDYRLIICNLYWAREPNHLWVLTKQANDSWHAYFATRTLPCSAGIKGERMQTHISFSSSESSLLRICSQTSLLDPRTGRGPASRSVHQRMTGCRSLHRRTS